MVHGQVAKHHHVARHEREAEHVSQVSGEAVLFSALVKLIKSSSPPTVRILMSMTGVPICKEASWPTYAPPAVRP